MDNDFNNAFDNLITEHMGREISRLREKSKRYGSALCEYSELIKKAERNEIDDYNQAFRRLAELGEYIRDLECRYLFYAGMETHKKMEDAILSFNLAEKFTE